MSELNIVLNSKKMPVTVQTLTDDFLTLGLKSGMILLVHSSLSSLGWVCGDAVAVVLALENVIGSEGTLVMPTHSSDYSDPADWCNPPVPRSWWEIIRETMPAYDPDLTPTRGMGKIPETFRKQKGVFRSSHPHVSFSAYGKYAEDITKDHKPDFSLGKNSPLGKIYDLNGFVLLLGVSHGNNSSLHLAEYGANYPGKKVIKCGAPVMIENKRYWKEFKDIDFNESDFELLGQDFIKDNKDMINIGDVGSSKCQLFSQRLVVDYAIEWFQNNRK